MDRWRYQDGGIMDRTHFRFFDAESAEELVKAVGYRVLESRYDGSVPLTAPVRKLMGPLARGIDFSASR